MVIIGLNIQKLIDKLDKWLGIIPGAVLPAFPRADGKVNCLLKSYSLHWEVRQLQFHSNWRISKDHCNWREIRARDSETKRQRLLWKWILLSAMVDRSSLHWWQLWESVRLFDLNCEAEFEASLLWGCLSNTVICLTVTYVACRMSISRCSEKFKEGKNSFHHTWPVHITKSFVASSAL